MKFVVLLAFFAVANAQFQGPDMSQFFGNLFGNQDQRMVSQPTGNQQVAFMPTPGPQAQFPMWGQNAQPAAMPMRPPAAAPNRQGFNVPPFNNFPFQQFFQGPQQQVTPPQPSTTTPKPEPQLPVRCLLSGTFNSLPMFCQGNKVDGFVYAPTSKTCTKQQICPQPFGGMEMTGFTTEAECTNTCILLTTPASPSEPITNPPPAPASGYTPNFFDANGNPVGAPANLMP